MGRGQWAHGTRNPEHEASDPVASVGDMSKHETLVALMRAMRLDDPIMYRAMMAFIRYTNGRRVEKKSTNQLTDQPR